MVLFPHQPFYEVNLLAKPQVVLAKTRFENGFIYLFLVGVHICILRCSAVGVAFSLSCRHGVRTLVLNLLMGCYELVGYDQHVDWMMKLINNLDRAKWCRLGQDTTNFGTNFIIKIFGLLCKVV